VAVLPVAVGLTGDDFMRPAVLSDGFKAAMMIMTVVAAVGGLIAWATVRNPERVPEEEGVVAPAPVYFCGAEGTPIDTCPRTAATEQAA
jgi:hypothetical protein